MVTFWKCVPQGLVNPPMHQSALPMHPLKDCTHKEHPHSDSQLSKNISFILCSLKVWLQHSLARNSGRHWCSSAVAVQIRDTIRDVHNYPHSEGENRDNITHNPVGIAYRHWLEHRLQTTNEKKKNLGLNRCKLSVWWEVVLNIQPNIYSCPCPGERVKSRVNPELWAWAGSESVILKHMSWRWQIHKGIWRLSEDLHRTGISMWRTAVINRIWHNNSETVGKLQSLFFSQEKLQRKIVNKTIILRDNNNRL